MNVSRRMLRVAAICALATVATTLVVHILPDLWTEVNTFEEAVRLPQNPFYMGRLWVVLLHCVLVVVSMFGIAALWFRASPGACWLGVPQFLRRLL